MRKSYKKSIARDEAEAYRELDVKAAGTEYLSLPLLFLCAKSAKSAKSG